ncbi:MAG: TlyA family RNA methyltransferase [Actinomycetota bacterium]
MSRRLRLDRDLVRRHLADSREDAQELISSGRVLVNGAPADKASRQVDPSDNLLITGEPARFVSRGGDKLQAALDHFGIDVSGRTALDVGASTGGFTDCLLQNGARHVVALDVGHGQLHPRVRSDERVTVIEGTNIRSYDPTRIGEDVDLVVADLSFISLTVVVPVLIAACKSGGDLIVLVKPQFEVGRREASRGKGVITDPRLHEESCRRVADALVEHGAVVQGSMSSPILGGRGNREFLLWATVRGRLPVVEANEPELQT